MFLPLALIGGGEGGHDHGEFAFAPREAGGFIHQAVADAGGGGLVDEKGAGVGDGIGVERDDFDALLLGFAERGRDALFVFGGHGDDVDAEGDPVLHDFVLFGGVGIGGAVEEQLDTEFLGGFVGARFDRDEISVALGFWEHRDD